MRANNLEGLATAELHLGLPEFVDDLVSAVSLSGHLCPPVRGPDPKTEPGLGSGGQVRRRRSMFRGFSAEILEKRLSIRSWMLNVGAITPEPDPVNWNGGRRDGESRRIEAPPALRTFVTSKKRSWQQLSSVTLCLCWGCSWITRAIAMLLT